jgi:hypothetical protein
VVRTLSGLKVSRRFDKYNFHLQGDELGECPAALIQVIEWVGCENVGNQDFLSVVCGLQVFETVFEPNLLKVWIKRNSLKRFKLSTSFTVFPSDWWLDPIDLRRQCAGQV